MMVAHLYELIQQRGRIDPTGVALGGQQGLAWKTITSRELVELVDRLAEELTSRGVRESDRVVLWVPNHWQTPIYLFAIWKLGAIAVPFDREMNPDAAVTIVASVAPRLVVVGYPDRPSWVLAESVAEWWEPGTLGPSGEPAADWSRPREELAALYFTSGTTGHPKGCMITHANLLSQVNVLGGIIPLGPDRRMASILPLSHLFELTCGLLYPLSQRTAIHYIPSRRGPDILRVLLENQITDMVAVPQLLSLMGNALDKQLRASLPAPIYRGLNALAERLPFPARRTLFWMVHRRLGGHLRLLASGGAALSAETQRFWERLGVRVVQGYGASECSPVIACGRSDGTTPIGSVGQPLPGVETRLSVEGELFVGGPNVMRGYWQDPGRTAEVLRDGWYATGDLATADPAGNLRLEGRARDLIVLPSGMKVWPQDVEAALVADPAVRDAVVLAFPRADGRVALHAYLIPATGTGTEAELNGVIARCNGHLAQHQRIATASWWPESDFPRTSTLKVRRNLFRPPRQDEGVTVSSVLASDDPVGQAIAGALRTQTLAAGRTLGELGLDSLGLVQLALALEEKTGQAVDEGDLRLDLTVEQVRELVARAPDVEESQNNRDSEQVGVEAPDWPYTWGRIFRPLALPFELIFLYAVSKLVVLGGEKLADLPSKVILAGTHHGFADMLVVRHALLRTPARGMANRLVIATAAKNWDAAPLFTRYAAVTFGLYPLRQRSQLDASLRGLTRLGERGHAILIFPQGHHTDPTQERAGATVARFQPGVALLAAALSAAVVPFGLAGTEKVVVQSPPGSSGIAIGGGRFSIRRGPLAIAFGEPLRLEPGESERDFTARLQERCFALTAQAGCAIGKGD
jgi:long-chain acyl-CoA synthetase